MMIYRLLLLKDYFKILFSKNFDVTLEVTILLILVIKESNNVLISIVHISTFSTRNPP